MSGGTVSADRGGVGQEALEVGRDDGGVRFWVRVQPRAQATQAAGVLGGALRVRVAAAPEGGRANRALVDFLARALGVAASRLELLSGGGSRSKLIRVGGLEPEAVGRALGLKVRPPGRPVDGRGR